MAQVTLRTGSWLMTDDALTKTLEQENATTKAMYNGDPGPMISHWAVSDDVTLFGAWGPIEKGHKPVTDTMQWVGSRFTGADAVDVERTVVASSGTLPTRWALSAAMSASTAARCATRCSGLPTSTGALTATGSSSTATPTSPLRSAKCLRWMSGQSGHFSVTGKILTISELRAPGH